jgi:hypothetical protein
MVVWRFSQTRRHRICRRSGRLGDRVDFTLDFKLIHYPKTAFLYNPMRLLHGSQFHVPPVAFCSAA